MEITYRKLRPDEYGLLKDFTYEAIFIPEGMEKPNRRILELPELSIYYDSFGNGKADYCIAAEDKGKVIGAVWTRLMNDYGHVDEETPSLAISLLEEYRGEGIGTTLMKKMLKLLKEKGYPAVSLSVQKANYACRMYEALGFQNYAENADERIMICLLNRQE